jgi:hypothetical protein
MAKMFIKKIHSKIMFWRLRVRRTLLANKGGRGKKAAVSHHSVVMSVLSLLRDFVYPGNATDIA